MSDSVRFSQKIQGALLKAKFIFYWQGLPVARKPESRSHAFLEFSPWRLALPA